MPIFLFPTVQISYFLFSHTFPELSLTCSIRDEGQEGSYPENCIFQSPVLMRLSLGIFLFFSWLLLFINILAMSYILFLLNVIQCFLLVAVLNIIIWSLVFNNLVIIHLGMFLPVFIPLQFTGNIFQMLWEIISHYFFKYRFYPNSLSSPAGTFFWQISTCTLCFVLFCYVCLLCFSLFQFTYHF